MLLFIKQELLMLFVDSKSNHNLTAIIPQQGFSDLFGPCLCDYAVPNFFVHSSSFIISILNSHRNSEFPTELLVRKQKGSSSFELSLVCYIFQIGEKIVYSI